jgi:hypothetical protein
MSIRDPRPAAAGGRRAAPPAATGTAGRIAAVGANPLGMILGANQKGGTRVRASDSLFSKRKRLLQDASVTAEEHRRNQKVFLDDGGAASLGRNPGCREVAGRPGAAG